MLQIEEMLNAALAAKDWEKVEAARDAMRRLIDSQTEFLATSPHVREDYRTHWAPIHAARQAANRH